MRDDENLTAERPTFVTHLECSARGARYAADELHNLSREGKPLLVRYDLGGIKKALSKEALTRPPRQRLLAQRFFDSAEIVTHQERLALPREVVQLVRRVARAARRTFEMSDEGRALGGQVFVV